MTAPDNDSTRVSVAIYGPKIRIIQQVVCDHFGIEVKRSQQHTRKGDSIKARQRIHYLCRIFVHNCPLSIIGLITGNGKPWDHASISNSYRHIKNYLEMRNPKGHLVYPEVYGEIHTLTLKVQQEFEKAKQPHDLKTCDHCKQPIIILE